MRFGILLVWSRKVVLCGFCVHFTLYSRIHLADFMLVFSRKIPQIHLLRSQKNQLKGTVSRDFSLLVFLHQSVFPQPQSIPLGPFQIFSKIRRDIRSSRLTTGVVDTGGKWEKSSIRKLLIILLGHLWIVELTNINIFAFKFTLRYLQPDSNPIVCHRCRWHWLQIRRRYRWHRWQICHRYQQH